MKEMLFFFTKQGYMSHVYDYALILNMFSIWAVRTEIRRKLPFPLYSIIFEQFITLQRTLMQYQYQ
jgi:hypothetical protein